MKKLILATSVFALSLTNAQTTNVYSWGFDAAFGADWTITNQSTPVGTLGWQKASFVLPLTSPLFGSGTVNTLPAGQAGGANSFATVNFNSTAGTGTISNWLITPTVNVKDGDVVSFYTRKGTDGTTDYPDRLELRYSTAATTVIPSGGSSGLGSFTTVGVTVNPALVAGFVYPQTWTKYQFTVSGIGSTVVPVKFGFRYFITNGGPTGANSDLIGIDTFSVDRSNLSTQESIKDHKVLSIYPNPTNDFLNLKTDSKILSVAVVEATGRKLNVKSEDNKIDVRNLTSGTYLINIETKEGKTTEKFIKK